MFDHFKFYVTEYYAMEQHGFLDIVLTSRVPLPYIDVRVCNFRADDPLGAQFAPRV